MVAIMNALTESDYIFRKTKMLISSNLFGKNGSDFFQKKTFKINPRHNNYPPDDPVVFHFRALKPSDTSCRKSRPRNGPTLASANGYP